MSILSDKIKKHRKELGLNQSELAHRFGVTQQQVARWENGSSTPPVDKLLLLAEVFGVGVDYLTSGITPNEGVDTKDYTRLMHENTTLKVELEGKKELIESLRAQIRLLSPKSE